MRWTFPPLVALALSYAIDAGPIGSAALFGAACALAMRLARRPMPLQFAAFAMFAAVSFGFMAAVFAALIGQDVHRMLAAPLAEQFVGIALGWLAAAFLGLAMTAALITWVRGSGETIDPEASLPASDDEKR
jgi:hypothetical protein